MASFTLSSTKNTETKDTVAQAINNAKDYAGELSIDVLPLSKVEIDPENKRELLLTLEDVLNGIKKDDPDYVIKRENWKSLETLARSIKNGQLINPIYVYRYGTKCRLISGERRTLASGIAGKKEIIARIASERPIGTKLRVLQWVENQERAELTLRERVASIEAIVNEYKKENRGKEKLKITGQLLSDLTGMSLPQCRRYQIILTAENELRNAVDQGQIENLKVIEFICSNSNKKGREELLAAAINGASLKELQKIGVELHAVAMPTEGKRGRKKINVSLGAIKPNVAQVILQSLIMNESLDINIKDKIKGIYNAVNWSDVSSISKSFKNIILVVENVATN